MSDYYGASCPLTPTLRAAIAAANTLTLTIRVHPTWSAELERLFFGVAVADPADTTANGTPGPYIVADSNRHTDGTARNAAGSGYLHSGGVRAAGAFGLSTATAGSWLDIAATLDISANPHRRRLFTRPPDGTWTLRSDNSSPLTATTFYIHPNANVLYIGTRYTNFGGPVRLDRWPGGIARASLAIGTGPSGTPGGTELAAWRATPPNPTYTDPHDNTWTLHGNTWTWGNVN